MSTNVLIVGAGPTGLTAATELARLGILPTVIDRRDKASTLSRAVGITPKSLELLSASGVSEQLIAQGVAMDGVRVYRGTKCVLSMPLHSDRTFFPTILGLPQDRTEAAISDVFSRFGGSINYGLSLSGLSSAGTGVTARLSDGSERHFDTVIGADGVNSTVRNACQIEYRGYDLPETWSIADVELNNWLHPGKITLVAAKPGTVLVIVPIGDTRYRIVASDNDALAAVPFPLDVPTVYREGTFNISIRHATTYTKGNIHLAGDAAHCHSPVGGRGMNLGIADAAELARCISENRVVDYTNLRHKQGADGILATERARKMVSGTTLARRLSFRTILALVESFGPLKKRLGRLFVEF